MLHGRVVPAAVEYIADKIQEMSGKALRSRIRGRADHVRPEALAVGVERQAVYFCFCCGLRASSL